MQRVKLSDQIAEQLEGMIADGTLKPGERLPAERQLAERLGISRPSLREAIQKLASKGLLSTRQGGGTFVTLEPSLHTRTNLDVIQAFLPREFTSTQEGAVSWRISCR